MIFGLDNTPADTPFPSPSLAETEPDGLLAVGGDLSIIRLQHAYRQGIFPWYNETQPILWWSPDPRAVLYVDELHVSRSLRKFLRKGRYHLSCNRAFERVLTGCASPRTGEAGTWLVSAMRQAYLGLHRAGMAHSIEVWDEGDLVGGLYGVMMGRMFFGESMFSDAMNASKVALVYLMEALQERGFELIDSQVETAHLTSMGARTIPRNEFLSILEERVTMSAPDDWPPPAVGCDSLEHAR